MDTLSGNTGIFTPVINLATNVVQKTTTTVGKIGVGVGFPIILIGSSVIVKMVVRFLRKNKTAFDMKIIAQDVGVETIYTLFIKPTAETGNMLDSVIRVIAKSGIAMGINWARGKKGEKFMTLIWDEAYSEGIILAYNTFVGGLIPGLAGVTGIFTTDRTGLKD